MMPLFLDALSWSNSKEVVDVISTPLLLVATFSLAVYTAMLARETTKTRQAGMQPLCYMRVKMLKPYESAQVGVTNVPLDLRLSDRELEQDPGVRAGRAQRAGTDCIMTVIRLELRVKNVGSGAALDLGIFPVAPGWSIRTLRKVGPAPNVFQPNNEQTIFFPEPLKGGEERIWTVELLRPYAGSQRPALEKTEQLSGPDPDVDGLRLMLAYEDVFGNRGSYEAGVRRHKDPEAIYPSTSDMLPKHGRADTEDARRVRLMAALKPGDNPPSAP